MQFAPLPESTIQQLLAQCAPQAADPARAAAYSQGSLTRARQAAEALELLSAAEQGPIWPSAVAAQLPRTAAAARQSAHAVLDVLTLALHRAWLAEQAPAQRKQLQEALNNLENYKIAVTRNVSPAIVVETALMGLDHLHVTV